MISLRHDRASANSTQCRVYSRIRYARTARYAFACSGRFSYSPGTSGSDLSAWALALKSKLSRCAFVRRLNKAIRTSASSNVCPTSGCISSSKTTASLKSRAAISISLAYVSILRIPLFAESQAFSFGYADLPSAHRFRSKCKRDVRTEAALLRFVLAVAVLIQVSRRSGGGWF